MPVANYLKKEFPIEFVETLENAGDVVNKLENGGVVLLENLRSFGDGEQKNDLEFTQKLASLGDIYVNEAFSVSHREHASIVGIPKILPAYAGPLFIEEVENSLPPCLQYQTYLY